EISLVAYPGETFEGRVMRIADTVDPQTRTVKVRAEMDNTSAHFRPEMFGSVHHIDSMEPTPILPVGAVIQGGGQRVVFVEVGPGRFQQTEVTVGKRKGDVVPLLNGVQAGERVVVDGAMLLKGLARNVSDRQAPAVRSATTPRHSRAGRHSHWPRPLGLLSC